MGSTIDYTNDDETYGDGDGSTNCEERVAEIGRLEGCNPYQMSEKTKKAKRVTFLERKEEREIGRLLPKIGVGRLVSPKNISTPFHKISQ